jgi:hypothetical protein
LALLHGFQSLPLHLGFMLPLHFSFLLLSCLFEVLCYFLGSLLVCLDFLLLSQPNFIDCLTGKLGSLLCVVMKRS